MTNDEIQAALVKAEVDAFEWATGLRSNINTMMGVESRFEDRVTTLARIEEADAASVHGAREKLLALRALAGFTPEGNDPYQLTLFVAGRTA